MSEARLRPCAEGGVAARAVSAWRKSGAHGGTCWWKAPWVDEAGFLVESGVCRSWRPRARSGCRSSLWLATGGASDSGHPGHGGSRTPATALGRDTVSPLGGGYPIAAGRGSANCAVAQGSADQQRSPSVAARRTASKAELPLSPRSGEAAAIRRRESARPGNGGFQRVLVTTSRLQRLVRGIFPGGLEACQRHAKPQRDSRPGKAHNPDQAGISVLRKWCSGRSGLTNIVARAAYLAVRWGQAS